MTFPLVEVASSVVLVTASVVLIVYGPSRLWRVVHEEDCIRNCFIIRRFCFLRLDAGSVVRITKVDVRTLIKEGTLFDVLWSFIVPWPPGYWGVVITRKGVWGKMVLPMKRSEASLRTLSWWQRHHGTEIVGFEDEWRRLGVTSPQMAGER